MSDNVASLLREREGYVVRGLKDRVAQVDAQLARLGYAVEETAAAAPVENTSRRGRRAGKPTDD